MHRVQELMQEHRSKDEHGREDIVPPVIRPKFASTPNCKILLCMACKLAQAKRRNAQVSTSTPVAEKKDILSWNRYEVGDFVSADQFVVTVPG